MMRIYPSGKGFTLIELLIVVAIIAILAAIAVPNFLEAQVRSKVARVKNDMRTLATAFESYMVDYNTYPQPSSWPHMSGDLFRMRAYIAISTPVAYLTTGVLRDPFMEVGSKTGGVVDPAKVAYELGFAKPGVRASDLDNKLRPPNNEWTNRSMFLIDSFGPDRDDDTSIGNFGRLSYGIPNATRRVYDSTNGTRSDGDIYRVGGPSVFQQYYAGAI